MTSTLGEFAGGSHAGKYMTMAPLTFGPLAVMGGGNMATAIVRGGIAAGILDPRHVIVCEPDPLKRASLAGLGILTTDRHAEAAETGWPILLAVKPQSFAGLADQLRPLLSAEPRLAVSILAGTEAASIHAALGRNVRIVRVMPNTPVSIRRGVSAICRGPGATDDDLELTETLFASVGSTIRIDESMMNAATAVVGSGPAYVYYLAEAMIAAAIEAGFAPDAADRLVRGTIEGAALLLTTSSPTPPATLREGVTSKGGTTAAAIAVLDQAAVSPAIRKAVIAARDRGAELAQLAKAGGA